MSRSEWAILLLCPIFGASGCNGSTADFPDEAFLVTDSAGVVIAESFHPAWEDDGGWSVAPEPELAIGAGATGGDDPDNPAFGWIRGLQVMSDGRIAVADATVAQVLVFDASGRFTHRFGGRGEGPGELRYLGGLRGCGGDTLIAASAHVFNFFDAEGNFVRRVPPGGSGRAPNVWLVSDDCRRFLVSEVRMPEPAGEEGYSYDFVAWTDETFVPRDTIGALIIGQYQPMTMEGGGLSYAGIPWTARSPLPVGSDETVIGYGRWPELRFVTPAGVKRIVRWHAAPEPITDEDRRRFEEERAACLARYDGEAIPEESGCDSLQDFNWLPSHKLHFDDLRRNAHGNVWVRAIPGTSLGSSDENRRREPAEPERWTVLSASGKWLGTVRMPDGLSLEQVANGRVYGVHRDELGVATVRVHRIEKD